MHHSWYGIFFCFGEGVLVSIWCYNVVTGFGILMVNYRGSIGAGQESVEFLLGKIGDSDVKDVHLATLKALKQFPFLNPEKVVLFGGSHGGFLVTHLSGQFPVMISSVRSHINLYCMKCSCQ
jgi:hypothetical protein